MPGRTHSRALCIIKFGQMSLHRLVLMMLFVVPLTTQGQSKIKPKDSVNMKNQIEGFYSWYIDISKNGKLNKDFNPGFVRQADGTTTLDFKNYKDGLRKYKFTEDFIQRKINDYKECVDNLNKTTFDKFSQFTDLDDFENINCDFGNRYEWTGGMESKDKAELTSLKLIDGKTIIGLLSFTSYKKPDGTATVTFKKIKSEWRIENLILE
jgi:hypothetical protein